MNPKIAVVLGALAPLVANSQTMTLISEYGIPIQLHLTEINETGTLAKFDSNLGILTGASLEIFGGAQFSLSGTNYSPQNQNARMTSDTSLSFSSSEGDVNLLIAAQSPNLDLAYATPILSYAPGQTRTFGPVAQSGSNVYDLASILPAVQTIGGGSFTINAQSSSGFTLLGGGGNLGTSQSTTVGAGARITYSYVIPEPSSALIASLPALALCLRRRRQFA
jgi:hypothetical protein